MKKPRDPYMFLHRRKIEMVPEMPLDKWGHTPSRYSPIIQSSREEITERWRDFNEKSIANGLGEQNPHKRMICTKDTDIHLTADKLHASVFEVPFRDYAVCNMGFTWSDGTAAEKLPGIKFSALGVGGQVFVENYTVLCIRPDGRLDTPGCHLVYDDMLHENPFIHAFKAEGKKSSIEPEILREMDILWSNDKWMDIREYIEGEASMDSVCEKFNLIESPEFYLMKQDRIKTLESKDPSWKSKYVKLMLFPLHRVPPYISKLPRYHFNHPKGEIYLGDRSDAIFKKQYGKIELHHFGLIHPIS